MKSYAIPAARPAGFGVLAAGLLLGAYFGALTVVSGCRITSYNVCYTKLLRNRLLPSRRRTTGTNMGRNTTANQTTARAPNPSNLPAIT